MRKPESAKVCLGDYVYAAYDGHGIILTVEDHDDIARHTIYLEPEVFHNLNVYVANIRFLSTYQGTEH